MLLLKLTALLPQEINRNL